MRSICGVGRAQLRMPVGVARGTTKARPAFAKRRLVVGGLQWPARDDRPPHAGAKLVEQFLVAGASVGAPGVQFMHPRTYVCITPQITICTPRTNIYTARTKI